MPRSSPRGSGPSEYLDLSSDAGFNQTTFEQSGRQVNILVKMNVKVNDSGSYRCEVLSGRDTSYAMDVYVINSKYPDFYTYFVSTVIVDDHSYIDNNTDNYKHNIDWNDNSNDDDDKNTGYW